MRPTRRLLPALAALLLASTALAAPEQATAETASVDAKRFDADTLWRWSWAGDPRLSPDGTRAVFERIDVDVAGDGYTSDLWLVDLGSGETRQLTSDPANDAGARWSPDGSKLVFTSSRVEPPQLFLLDLGQGGEARQLTYLDAGAGDPSWSPDGRLVTFTSRALPEDEATAKKESDEAEKTRREAPRRALLDDSDAELETAPEEFETERIRFRADGRPGYLPEERNQVWTIDVASGETWRLTDGDFPHGDPTFTADSRHVVFDGDRRDDADWSFGEGEVYRVAVGTPENGPGEAEALTASTGPQGDPLPSPDGEWIAYAGYVYDERKPTHHDDGLWVMRPDGSDARELTTGYDRAVGDGAGQDVAPPRGGAQRMRWAADSRSIYATSARDGQVDIVRVHLGDRDPVVEPVLALETGAIHGFDLAATADGPRFVVLASFPDRPLDLYAAEPGQSPSDWRRLTHTNEVIAAEYDFVDYEEIWVDSFDGQKIQGWIAKPPGFDPAKKYPMVLYIHGGPHAMYGSVFFHEFQVLAHAGYVVLFTNPRGSTGYGTDFANIIQYRYPGDDYKDLMASVDAVIERGYVDPERLGVAGGSGGGLLTTWTVGQTDRFAAAVAQRNVTNWHSFVGTADFNHAFVEAWFPGYPWEARENYLERSPLFYVDRVTTPVLLIHSEQDWRTPLEQTLQFYTALRMQKKPAKLVVFPEEPHGLSRMGRPSHRVARIEHIVAWFDRWLR